MAGARSLWRACGMKEEQFGKPVIAVVNSFTQFVPGHTHLHPAGQEIRKIIEQEGFFAAEFNTIAIDDGIAMGHDGMLYSLPSRDVIADSVEYMCNAHCADAMICISNCDKITPGMLMAAMRLNIPFLLVTGGPMEAGVVQNRKYDLVDTMVMAADPSVPDDLLAEIERQACPTCGSCSGMFTANSMNCLSEAIGLSLPGNGTIVATHVNRKRLMEESARRIVAMAKAYYYDGDASVLPRNIATHAAFSNAMKLDIAMGGSTNTVLHLLAIAHEAEVIFTMDDIDRLSRVTPNLCKVAPSSPYHVEDVNRAGGILGIMAELDRGGLLDTSVCRADGLTLAEALRQWDITLGELPAEALNRYLSAPGGARSRILGSQEHYFQVPDLDRASGCIRDIRHAYSQEGGLAVLRGNLATHGAIVKTAGVDSSMFTFKGLAKVFDSQDEACHGILNGMVTPGDVVVIRYEGPRGGPGMQEMLYPTSYLKSMKLERLCALITDGRFSGGTAGLSVCHVSPEAAAGGTIALVRNGDPIEIDIPGRSLNLAVPPEVLEQRRSEEAQKEQQAWKPANRTRRVSAALRAYAGMVSSADLGAVRIVPG